MKLKILLPIIVFLLFGMSAVFFNFHKWDKVFPKSDKVIVKKVSFHNRYGIKLVGDLYIPKDTKKGNYQQ